MIIAHEGRKLKITEWAKLKGLTPASIYRRLEDGWSIDRALNTPLDRAFTSSLPKITKNDAEMMLNELPYEKLPIMLAALIPENYRSMKYKWGQYLRNEHRALFDLWFSREYKPKKL